MHPEIEAIFIDLGNTMRILVKDEQHQTSAREKIATMVGAAETPGDFCLLLDQRYKVYRKWAFQTRLEATESELWTKWLLPEYPAERIAPISTELTFQYRQSMGKRVLQPDARFVVETLDQRGYKLGIISNVITSKEIHDWLVEDDLAKYFKSVVLSSLFRHRKPDPEIYWEAAQRIGVPPERCVYVGDNPDRDVEGTRKAGFGMVIILLDPKEHEKEPACVDNRPDVVIHEFKQLLDIFPAK